MASDESQTTPRPAEEDIILKSALSAHPERENRAALRCGLGDGATVCDLIAKRLLEEHRGRGGKGATTKLGRELAAIAKRCGDEIWALRERVSLT
jgi:hypothetical protein